MNAQPMIVDAVMVVKHSDDLSSHENKRNRRCRIAWQFSVMVCSCRRKSKQVVKLLRCVVLLQFLVRQFGARVANQCKSLKQMVSILTTNSIFTANTISVKNDTICKHIVGCQIRLCRQMAAKKWIRESARTLQRVGATTREKCVKRNVAV